MFRFIILLLLIFTVGCQTQPQEAPQRMPQSYDSETTSSSDLVLNEQIIASHPGACIGIGQSNPHFASNSALSFNGKTYTADTYFTIHQTEDGVQAIAHLTDGSGSESDENGTYDIIDIPNGAFSCEDFTSIPMSTDENGEVQLGEYSLPVDILVAGKKKKPRKRKKGTTYCYREVKRVVRKQITLTGVAAYMANAQLKAAGWKRHSSYKRAPKGSICVFNKGGKVTRSGGHKYGHIGIKGRGGVINPETGFRLKRPFLGCYTKR